MKRLPLVSLFLMNLTPILGVFLLDWDLFSILFFYWLESAVVGIYNIPRMILAGCGRGPVIGILSVGRHRLSGVVFYLIHYSAFMAGHGFFIFQLFSPAEAETTPIVLGLLALTVSHGVSFAVNFVGHREYERVSLSEQMVAPYKRIMVMHLTIILCGFLLNLFDALQVTFIFLVLLKITIDVVAHVREHQRLGTYVKVGSKGMQDVRRSVDLSG